MTGQLKARLEASFELTKDLVRHIDEEFLTLDLPNLPSNRVAGQFWCIVGARESYTRAIEAGSWQGFSCSLGAPLDRPSLLEALERTQECLAAVDFSELSDALAGFAFQLLEHEVQHHGQLIRYVYGNGRTFPESWRERYTV